MIKRINNLQKLLSYSNFITIQKFQHNALLVQHNIFAHHSKKSNFAFRKKENEYLNILTHLINILYQHWHSASAFLIITFLFLASCNPTKYVADDEQLLDKVKISGHLDEMTHDELMDYVRQKPNVRVLGFWRLGLNIYNLSGNKDNGWNRWLRTIGSEPVIFDSIQVDRSREQLSLYAQSRGYFDAIVTDTIYSNGEKKCVVDYNVNAGQIYRISSSNINVIDDSIRPIIQNSMNNTLLKAGQPFDSNLHDAERARITRLMQQNGYYNFSKEHIYFIADSTVGDHLISDSTIVINDIDPLTNLATLPHRQFKIGTVSFNVANTNEDRTTLHPIDSVTYHGLLIRYAQKPVFNNQLLANSCFIKPNELYNIQNVELTQQRFNSLKLFRSTNIKLSEDSTTKITNITPDSIKTQRPLGLLNCNINLVTGNQQAYSVEVEGTNSSGNLGGAFSIGYSHNNIFRNAEVFDVKMRLATQNQSARDGKEHFFTLETGVDVSLTVPNVIAPFVSHEFNRKRNPSTVFTFAYDYQRRPDFTKSSALTKLSYNWHGSRYVTHTFTPAEINYVSIPTISDNFADYIRGTYLQYSYHDHFIMSLNYTFLFNQQKVRKLGTAWYFRSSVETAGNLLSALLKNKEKDNFGSRHFFNIGYSQYVKSDIELRFQQSDIWQNHFVYRLFAGIGIPYGNSQSLPFEKSYFAGGANSIRAWAVRGLGPGSSKGDASLKYHNQIGDIRLEMNAEYRYKMISILEGAIFADAGNIWMLKKSTNKPEEQFSNKFYKQIALGAGLGLRLNFDYFIIRFDAASKLYDPSKDENKRWVIARERYGWNKINFNFAIGYPF